MKDSVVPRTHRIRPSGINVLIRATLMLSFSLAALCAFGQSGRTNAASKVYRERIEPHWFADANNQTNRFWYRLDLAEGKREFIVVDAEQGTRGPAFDHDRLARTLAGKTGNAVEPGKLPFDSIRFSEDGKSVRLFGGDAAWLCDLESYELSPTEKEEKRTEREPSQGRGRRSRPGPANVKSPDGKWEAVVRDHNLFLRDLGTEAEEQLTRDATATNSYARDSQRERAVEMQYDLSDPEAATPEVYWSPDSRWLMAMRRTPGTQRKVYLIASSPKDQVQPKLDSYPYLKPGDDVPIRKPHLFRAETGDEIAVSDELFPNPWSIGDIRWAPDSARFTFLYNQRGHQVLRVIEVAVPDSTPPPGASSRDAADVGKPATAATVRAIVDERSDTFVCYSGKFFNQHIEDTGEIIWMSERDGWNHLYLYDAKAGRVKNQITKGEWVVRDVERVDKEKREIWFRAGGIRPEQDPYYVHYCRVNFDGTGLTILTEGDGTHSVQFSPDRRFFVDTWSRVDLPPIHELRRSDDGKLICKLEEADASELLATGWKAPERFVAKGRDGTTDIYGIIHRPANFDSNKTYPIIESIYAGPHSSFVPKAFRPSFRWEKLAERGFVIVQIDGMGTSDRSKKFHDVCWKNIGDAGFPDRILWMKAAAAKYPYLDVTRVGIYGGSAGGQNALRALLAHGDFYKAAAADCGCHDNRMDKIWWNEQWMGWPVGPEYEEQSNVTQAHRLQGKLLLTVGELDRNVDPASTMQVVNALIKADKDFDLIVFPGAGHGAGGSPYGERRRNEFFVRHLLGPQLETQGSAGTASAR